MYFQKSTNFLAKVVVYRCQRDFSCRQYLFVLLSMCHSKPHKYRNISSPDEIDYLDYISGFIWFEWQHPLWRVITFFFMGNNLRSFLTSDDIVRKNTKVEKLFEKYVYKAITNAKTCMLLVPTWCSLWVNYWENNAIISRKLIKLKYIHWPKLRVVVCYQQQFLSGNTKNFQPHNNSSTQRQDHECVYM